MKLFGIKLSLQGKKRGYAVLRLSRDDYIFWSAIILSLSFLGFTGYDAYLFYQDIFGRASAPSGSAPQSRFSNKDIDEIITLLDERKNAYDDILQATPASPRQ